MLVQQCGWARPKGGALVLTEAGRDLLQQFTPRKFRDGVSRCLANDDFDELVRVNHLRGQGSKAARDLSSPAKRKVAIARAMTSFPVGQWLEYAEACRLIEASPERWEVLESNRPVLRFFDPEFGFIHDRTGLARQFLRAFFLESLTTLGVLDAGFVHPHYLWPELKDSLNGDLPFCGRYDGLVYVRLNALGAYVLEFTDRYESTVEASPKLFRVLPNLDVVLARGPLNPANRATLELLAAPKSEMVWTLEAERMLTHVDTGGAFQELRDFLEANAEDGLPAEVQVFLADLETKLGACRALSEAVMIEWTDEALARLIATNTGASKLCHHAGGNRLVVSVGNLAAFRRAVKRLGYVVPSGH